MVYCEADIKCQLHPSSKEQQMLSRIGRVFAAAALIISGVAIASVTSNSVAGAANTSITVDCSPTANTPVAVNNGDTVTITVGTGCAQVLLDMFGSGGTATAGGFPLSAGAPVGVAPGDTVVYTAPNSGDGQDGITFLVGGAPSSRVIISFPPPTGSMVDQGNGSMVVTYTGEVLVILFPNGTTCPSPYQGQTASYYLDSNIGGASAMAASPATITAGTNAMGPMGPQAIPIAANIYEACLYFQGNATTTLQQALTVTLGQVTPSPDPDAPVNPSFTG